MTLYNWLCLLGIPSAVTAIVGYIMTKFRKLSKEDTALKQGIQALLRAQMISEYNKWSERGFAPIYARENFENMWQNYHSLGANGVMNDIHNKFMKLPTSELKGR